MKKSVLFLLILIGINFVNAGFFMSDGGVLHDEKIPRAFESGATQVDIMVRIDSKKEFSIFASYVEREDLIIKNMPKEPRDRSYLDMTVDENLFLELLNRGEIEGVYYRGSDLPEEPKISKFDYISDAGVEYRKNLVGNFISRKGWSCYLDKIR